MGDKDFFLSPDDSKTLGDINYMRKSVRVKRTFPKTLKNQDGFAIEKEVSATEFRDSAAFMANGGFNSVNNGNSNGYASSQTDYKAMAEEIKAAKPAKTEGTRSSSKTDTNLDMFRNMARSMKKRY